MLLHTPDQWHKSLPIGLIDWIDRKTPHRIADLCRVTTNNNQYRFYWEFYLEFADGHIEHMLVDKLYLLIAATLIEGYNDIYSPNVWIDRFIMRNDAPLAADRSADVPNYALPLNALKVFLKIARRPDDDPFLFSFAYRLLDDHSLSKEEIIPVFRMMLLSADRWKPRQICTAAYHAYCYEISMRGSVPDCATP